MAQMQVEIPGDLNNIATAVQGAVEALMGGQNIVSVIGSAMPVLFAEGQHIDDIKAQLKDPKNLVWAGLLVGGLAAKYGPVLFAKLSKKNKVVAAAVSPEAPAVAPVV